MYNVLVLLQSVNSCICIRVCLCSFKRKGMCMHAYECICVHVFAGDVNVMSVCMWANIIHINP